MVFDLLAMMFLDGGIAAVFNSPFIIPVAGCAMVACIVVSSVWAGVRSQEIKSHERLARIAQGLPLESSTEESAVRMTTEQVATPTPAATGKLHGRLNDGGGARRAGLVLCSVGSGLIAFFVALAIIVRTPEVMSGGAAGLIPFAIGVGFLIDARLKRGDYERWMDLERMRWQGGGLAMGAGSPVPPPPPAGMTAAQASDWRPSSSTLK